nr:GNAT family N-acetyltransferase [Litoribacter alkaliphilus]
MESLSDSDFLKKSSNFDLIYIFSEDRLDDSLITLVDRKVVLVRENNKKDSNCDIPLVKIRLFDPITDNFEKLLKLGLQSGLYSRFNKDPNFQDGVYNKLYTLWIEKLVSDSNSQVWVINYNSDMVGFIGFSVIDQQYADIILVGIDENFRGQGYGNKLLNYVLSKISYLGINKVQVTTQLDNFPAMGLYQRNDFKIKNITNIYHFWKK